MQTARRAATRSKILTTPIFKPRFARPWHLLQQTTHYSTTVPEFDNVPKSEKSNPATGSSRSHPKKNKRFEQSIKLEGNVDSMPSDVKSVPGVTFALEGADQGVSHTKDSLIFTYSDQSTRRFPVEQLRDACSCHLCRDTSSGQKSFPSTEIPNDMQILNAEAREKGELVVTVDKDMDRIGAERGHDIILAPSYIQKLTDLHFEAWSLPTDERKTCHIDYWDKEFIQKNVRKINYEDFMKPESTAFWDAIQDIKRLGLVFLQNVPRDAHSVEHIAERICCIRETFYGRTFDVRAKPNAENVAYTNGYLGLHQDLLYLNPMPYMQILHCMDNDCTGGESLFSDADRIGRMLYGMRGKPPYSSIVQDLEYRLIPYGYQKDGYNYHQRHPLIRSNKHGYRGVRWSPPFQAEIDEPMLLNRWMAGARAFEKAVNHESAMYQTKMAPGECVIFNNQRILHGRTAFDAAGGSRWLRGTYLSLEDFWSKASHMPETHITEARSRTALRKGLQETEMAEMIRGWLGEEMKAMRDYGVSDSYGEAGEKKKGEVSESIDALFPELTKRISKRQPPAW